MSSFGCLFEPWNSIGVVSFDVHVFEDWNCISNEIWVGQAGMKEVKSQMRCMYDVSFSVEWKTKEQWN